jgi:hypothetical protein
MAKNLTEIIHEVYNDHVCAQEDRGGPSSLLFRSNGGIIYVSGEIDFDTYHRICAALDAGPSGPFKRCGTQNLR